jgi:hypothetical protein
MYLYGRRGIFAIFKSLVRHVVSIVNIIVFLVNGTPISRHSLKCSVRRNEEK